LIYQPDISILQIYLFKFSILPGLATLQTWFRLFSRSMSFGVIYFFATIFIEAKKGWHTVAIISLNRLAVFKSPHFD